MRNSRIPQLTTRLAALLALFATPVEAADELLFERPDSLQPAIAFWTRVYSEVDSLSGFVHDSRNLDIVYETLQLEWYDSPQVQDDKIEKTLRQYRGALRALAGGKRETLTAREKKVLDLWGDRGDRETLSAAADNVRFQRGQADRIRDGITRAGAWEGHIRETLRDFGLPEVLAALPHVESSYNTRVKSHAGAAGLWQFTLFTGRHYLRVDHIVDERVDPVKSTEGAARLLQKYYSRLHSWPLAITAYNHGLSGVRRAVRDTGSSDIGDIVQRYRGPRFGFASRNYYAAFLAAADVTGNTERYFGPIERREPEDYWIVKVPSYLPVKGLAEQLELDTAAIRSLNPALQRSVWNGTKRVPKHYPLRLPATTANATIEALLTRVEGHARQIPDLFYRVQKGDTLSGIALRHNHTIRDLMALNNLSSENRILAGQSLRLSSAVVPEALRVAAMETARDGERKQQSSPGVSSESVATVP